MKKIFKDWRNIALMAAALLVIILLIVIMTGGERATGVEVRVGGKDITVAEFNKSLKKRFGEQLIKETVSQELVSRYAAMKNVTASDSEINQLIDQQRRGLHQQGYTLEDYLQASGLTMDVYKEIQRTDVLKVKLAVPTDEITKVLQNVQKTNDPFLTYPQSSRYRVFYFPNDAFAQQALVSLRAAGNDEAGKQQLVSVASTTLYPDTAMKIIGYSPESNKNTVDPELVKVINNLQPNQWSEPFKEYGTKDKPVADSMKDVRRVVQLIDVLPEEKPTMANRSIIFGLAIIQQRPEFANKLGQIEAEARQKIEVSFMNNDFPLATKYFNDMYKENQLIPSAPVSPGGSGTNIEPAPLPLPDAKPTQPKSGK